MARAVFLLLRLAAAAALYVATVAPAAPAEAAGGRTQPAPPPLLHLEPSSVSCTQPLPGASPALYRPCTFSNIYLWRGKGYYVVRDGEQLPDLTQLGLRFEVWSKKESSDAVLDMLQTISTADFAALLLQAEAGVQPLPARGAPAGSGDASGSSSSSQKKGGGQQQQQAQEMGGLQVPHTVIPRAYLWKARRVNPSQHMGPCDKPGSGATGKSNYGHFSAEWMPPLFMTLCEVFGHCSYEDRAALQIIDVQPKGCNRQESYPPYYTEMLSCLASTPLRHIGGAALREQGLTVVEEAWAGLSPRCRGIPGGCYSGGSGGRLPPTPRLLASWRRLLGRCLGVEGLEGAAAAPLAPAQLLLVDREYLSGRHLLNVNSIIRALSSRLPLAQVNVRLAYMEGLSVRQQALLWSNCTVVLHMHGAALGNYFFLPRGAVAVQLAPLPEEEGRPMYNPTIYTDRLQGDLSAVTNITALNWVNNKTSRVHLNTENVAAAARRKPNLRKFLENSTLYGEFLSTFRCPGPGSGVTPDLRAACISLLLHLNIVMDPGEAADVAEAALKLAFQKQGRELIAPAASGSALGSEGGSRVDRAADDGLQPAGGRPAGAGAVPAWGRLHGEGGTQLLALGCVLGTLGVLCLRGISRLTRQALK